MTPHGATTSYLTPTDFLTYWCDPRWVADKVSFDGNRVGANPDGSVNVAAVAANPVVQRVLNGASGRLEAAALKGNRYQAADLQALAGTVAADFLASIIAGIAKGILMGLRPEPGVPLDPEYVHAMEWLAELANGERIFAFAETQDAGLPGDVVDTPATVQARNGLVVDARRFFGRRNNQDLPGRGGRWGC